MQDFLQKLHAATPRTWVTQAIIGLNVAAFVLAALAGVDIMAPSAQSLLEVGGNWLPYTREQPWRLFSAMFLHAGLIHIGFNMWALRDMGMIAERFYGKAQFLLIYVVSGLFASLASLFFSAANSVSVGASGAVFGVAGAILAALLTDRTNCRRRS
ncbi:MAG: rhomboid family intramembrane serine protease [Burkholderiaceae bacterium]